jgi:Lon protease-like protein
MLNEKRELPIFPLNVVLFPGMTLPLRIFEPRYQQMLADCLEGDQAFGVVLIKEGQEVGRPAVPHEIGTVARILSVEKKNPDLTHISTVGVERFWLRRERRRLPYLIGEIEPYPLALLDEPDVEKLTHQATILLRTYLDLLSRASGADIKLQRPPTEPKVIAYLIAMILQVTLSEKQRLLSIPDLPALFREEFTLLRNEGKLLSVMIRAMENLDESELSGEDDSTIPFSKN